MDSFHCCDNSFLFQSAVRKFVGIFMCMLKKFKNYLLVSCPPILLFVSSSTQTTGLILVNIDMVDLQWILLSCFYFDLLWILSRATLLKSINELLSFESSDILIKHVIQHFTVFTVRKFVTWIRFKGLLGLSMYVFLILWQILMKLDIQHIYYIVVIDDDDDDDVQILFTLIHFKGHHKGLMKFDLFIYLLSPVTLMKLGCDISVLLVSFSLAHFKIWITFLVIFHKVSTWDRTKS
jgi:hypothetical protein